MSPPFSQCLEAGQRGTGIVSIIDDRAGVRAEDRRIIVYSVDPQIEQDIHLRAFACLDQLVDFSNREKEETSILFAGIIVFQGSIIILPVGNLEFDQTVFLQQGIGNAAFLLEMLQDGYGLMLKPATKPILQF
jgi:hypothetical protein